MIWLFIIPQRGTNWPVGYIQREVNRTITTGKVSTVLSKDETQGTTGVTKQSQLPTNKPPISEKGKMAKEYRRARALFEHHCPRCMEDLKSMALDMATKHVFTCLAAAKKAEQNKPSDTNAASTKPSKPAQAATTGNRSRLRSNSLDNDPTYVPPGEGDNDDNDDGDDGDDDGNVNDGDDGDDGAVTVAQGQQPAPAATKVTAEKKDGKKDNTKGGKRKQPGTEAGKRKRRRQ